MDVLKSLIKELAGSKKFAALLVGVLAGLAVKLGMEEPAATEIAKAVWGLAAVYIGGQAIADHGKEKAKIERDA